jgi:hypothetical protein
MTQVEMPLYQTEMISLEYSNAGKIRLFDIFNLGEFNPERKGCF